MWEGLWWLAFDHAVQLLYMLEELLCALVLYHELLLEQVDLLLHSLGTLHEEEDSCSKHDNLNCDVNGAAVEPRRRAFGIGVGGAWCC